MSSDPRASELRGWAALAIALGGLTTALGAVIRKPPEEGARAAYLELTKSILDSQAAERQNHEDILALRGFVESYAKGHEVIVAPVDAGAPQVVHASAPASAAPPPHVAPLKPQAPPRPFEALP